MSGALYPWHGAVWAQLAAGRDRLPHALLLNGPAGLGKRVFALHCARWLLCQAPTQNSSCGHCRHCRQTSTGVHPDLHVLQPQATTRAVEGDALDRHALRYQPEQPGKRKKPSAVIPIDAVRRLIDALLTHAHSAGCKVAVLAPADAMNQHAANSLLKLLEEPPRDTYLILASSQSTALPATIRSRCMRIDFRIPDRDMARAWLQGLPQPPADPDLVLGLAGGAPLVAATLGTGGFMAQRQQMHADMLNLSCGSSDPVHCAAAWQDVGLERALTWLQGWVTDLIRLAFCEQPPSLHNPDMAGQLKEAAKKLNVKQLFAFLQVVYNAKLHYDGPLDGGLLLEDVLIRWSTLRHNR